MPMLFNTFDSGLSTALQRRLVAYLEALGDDCRAKVVGQAEKESQVSPLVAVSPTEMTEEVYQSGIYRLGVEVIIRVDQDAGNPDQLLHLSAAVLDFLQQVDLISQLNSVMDENGRALCYVQLIIIEQSRLEDIGDRQWRRVYALTVLGCMPS